MESFIRYILISTSCLSLFYLGYLVFMKKEFRFNYLRYFFLISIVLSLLLPFSHYSISFDSLTKNVNEEIPKGEIYSVIQSREVILNQVNTPDLINYWNVSKVLFYLYFLGVGILGIRLLIQLSRIFYLFIISIKSKQDNAIILNSEKIENPFSFFHWIFIPKNLFADNLSEDILKHERIHGSQYHSIDLILIELLSAVMWFNPLVWMMRNTVQLVHEYLADEGVLNTGTDKLKYQALLVNQIAEERLICLSSSFNHSLIKKRIIMMTKSKLNQGPKLRILVLIPLATILFAGVACVNGQNKTIVTAVEPVRMNVLYIGVDNPVKIASSGYDASELIVSVNNGIILGSNGEYIIRPKEQGIAIVSINNKGKEIQSTTFRVKVTPDPVAKVSGRIGGDIKKQELLNVNTVETALENFDFDLSFDIVEFKVSAIDVETGVTKEFKSNSNLLTEEQRDIIGKSIVGSRITFDGIICKGPDGNLRKLPSIVLKIVE